MTVEKLERSRLSRVVRRQDRGVRAQRSAARQAAARARCSADETLSSGRSSTIRRPLLPGLQPASSRPSTTCSTRPSRRTTVPHACAVDRPHPDRQAHRLRVLPRPQARPQDPDRRVRGQLPRQQRTIDGPFDQLPDNFIQGDALREAIMAAEPSLRARSTDSAVSPTAQGASWSRLTSITAPADLLPFHRCVTNKHVPAEDYYACFVMDWGSEPEIAAIKRLNGAVPKKAKKPRKSAMARSTR